MTMKIAAWPNKLGCDVTVKGRTWECLENSGTWYVKLHHNGTWRNDCVGQGPTFLHAIALAKRP